MENNKMDDKELEKVTGGSDYYDNYLTYEVGCYYLKNSDSLIRDQIYAKITKMPYTGDRVYFVYTTYSYNVDMHTLTVLAKGNRVIFTTFQNNFASTKTELNSLNIRKIYGE